MTEQDKNTDKAPPEELDGDKLDQAVGGSGGRDSNVLPRESQNKREETNK